MRVGKELLKRMPKHYRELNWRLYMEVINNVLIEKPVNMDDEDFKSYQAFSMISILLNVSITELEELPYIELIPLINSLSFLNQEITMIGSTSVKVKDIETLGYKAFQSLVQLLPDQWNHMDSILEVVTKDITKEEIDKLSIWEVIQIIGKLRRSYQKSFRRSQISLAFQLIKMSLKMKMKKIFKIKD